MRQLFHAVLRALEAGQDVQLVTIAAAAGSTPRGAGAMMAVFPDGACAGTVGGGAVELAAQRRARSLLAEGRSALEEAELSPGGGADMACGGRVTLHFHCLSGESPLARAVFRDLLEADGESRDAWLLRRLEGPEVQEMGVADRGGCRYLRSAPPADLLDDRPQFRDGWLVLPAVRAGRVYVFGGGHVSQALVPILAAASFRPVVYDDRPEFASPALFPQAAGTLCAGFGDLAGHVALTPDDYVVVMTRGHQADYEVLAQTLRSGARYLGCIGSRRKLALCRERLLAAGFTEAEYARLHAPIGLAIGAQTPVEIAVSVAAELIAVRAGVLA